MPRLNQVTTFTYGAECWSHPSPGMQPNFSFLQSFQSLQHLTLLAQTALDFYVTPIFALTFPLLESFVLEGSTPPRVEPALKFLAAHPLLHTLKCGQPRFMVISSGHTDSSADPVSNISPRLARLDSPLHLVRALFPPSMDASSDRRPLISLCTPLLLSTQDSTGDLDLLRRVGHGLEELAIGKDPETVKWHVPDLETGLRMLSAVCPYLRLLDFGSVSLMKGSVTSLNALGSKQVRLACSRIVQASLTLLTIYQHQPEWVSALSDFKHLIVLTIPGPRAKEAGLTAPASRSRRRQQAMEHFLAACPRLRFLFSTCRNLGEPHMKLAILIGPTRHDVALCNRRLLDQGAVEGLVWAAYEGKRIRSDLDEEVSMALGRRDQVF